MSATQNTTSVVYEGIRAESEAEAIDVARYAARDNLGGRVWQVERVEVER